MLSFGPLHDVDPAVIEALLDSAFGADRRTRTAYAIRQGMTAIPTLSFAALESGALVGSIQCWPVALHGDDGTRVPMVMVGPVAVAPARQNSGIGRALLERTLAVIDRSGDTRAQMLIGDPEYYGRFFGFSADRTQHWRLPGPFERRRLLARGEAICDAPGIVGPEA